MPTKFSSSWNDTLQLWQFCWKFRFHRYIKYELAILSKLNVYLRKKVNLNYPVSCFGSEIYKPVYQHEFSICFRFVKHCAKTVQTLAFNCVTTADGVLRDMVRWLYQTVLCLLNVLRIYGIHINATYFASMRKIRHFLSQFSRKSQLLARIMCRSLAPNFIHIRHYTFSVGLEIIFRL